LVPLILPLVSVTERSSVHLVPLALVPEESTVFDQFPPLPELPLLPELLLLLPELLLLLPDVPAVPELLADLVEPLPEPVLPALGVELLLPQL
jgi:hypothetical protein